MIREIANLTEAASSLTPYAVSVRYPDDFEVISEEEAKQAYNLSEGFKNYIQSKIIFIT